MQSLKLNGVNYCNQVNNASLSFCTISGNIFYSNWKNLLYLQRYVWLDVFREFHKELLWCLYGVCNVSFHATGLRSPIFTTRSRTAR